MNVSEDPILSRPRLRNKFANKNKLYKLEKKCQILSVSSMDVAKELHVYYDVLMLDVYYDIARDSFLYEGPIERWLPLQSASFYP